MTIDIHRRHKLYDLIVVSLHHKLMPRCQRFVLQWFNKQQQQHILLLHDNDDDHHYISREVGTR